MKLVLTVMLAFALLGGVSGCGTLIPKKVELFQKKVQKVPDLTAYQKELQRRVARLAKDRASQTVDFALQEKTSTNLVAAARDTEKLTDSVSTSLGPPITPASSQASALILAEKLNSEIGRLDRKIDRYAERTEDVAGKKIEGTGLVQVPYFVWLGGIIVIIIIAKFILKDILGAAAMSGNPAAAVGLGAMNVAGSVVQKGFLQLVHGGEDFKNWVEKEVSDTGLQQKILTAFRSSHESKQDQDVQAVVKQLTK